MVSNSTVRSTLFSEQLSHLDEGDKFLFSKRSPKYQFTIIGTGMIGMEHIRITLLEGRGGVHGIYDSNQRSMDTAEALVRTLQHAPVKCYATLEQACTDPATDALIVCTPNHTHVSILETAIKSKKPILLEKPMATTIEDAYRVLAISREYESFIQVGLQYRYKAIYQECYSEAVNRKSLGALKTIAIMEHRLPFLDKVNQWNKFSELSGGTLVEKCCHYFDLFNLFAASTPVSVTSMGDMAVNFKDFSYDKKKSDIIDNALVLVRYENGVKANLNLCMFSPMFHEEITLCGAEGRIRAYETEDFLSGSKIKTGFEMRCSNGIPAKDAVLRYPAIIEESGHAGSTFFEQVHFIDTMEGNTAATAPAAATATAPTATVPAAATVEEGLWSIIVGVAATESIKQNRTIYIDELTSRPPSHDGTQR